MFNQQEYINDYIKNNYKTIKLRIRKDNRLLNDALNNTKNINQYIISLIKKDIYANRTHNFINDDIKIDFELSKTMQDLVDKAEEADLLNDYGLYMNLADAIDTRAKNEVNRHLINESQWNKLARRYII